MAGKRRSSKKSGSCKKGSKRRMNGYIKFFLCKLKGCRGTPVTEVAKIAGKEWCKLSAEEKLKWTNKN